MLFGTDGIRGTINMYPMTPSIVLRFSIAVGLLLQRISATRHSKGHKAKVIIAKDTRLSGYVIEPALTSGLASVGINVMLVGPMPTPAVPMLIKSLRADLGIMITASHNPFHDNGLKIFDENGYKLSSEYERQLQQTIIEYDSPEYNGLDHSLAAPDALGRVSRLDDAHGRYIEYVKSCFPKHLTLEGMKIVVDCANGATYRLAPSALWELGADVITVGTDPNGININEGCGSMHPSTLSTKVIETGSDIGIALDGDGDRVLICDEMGNVIHGDHVIGLIAVALHKNGKLCGDGVVTTHACNGALDKYLSNVGLKTYRTNIGDKYVSQEMRHRKCNFGGETSGHIILGDYTTTGDGTIAALQITAILKASGKNASEILHAFPLNPQSSISIPIPSRKNPLDDVEVQFALEEIKQKNNDIKIIVRKSGTENVVRVTVEGQDMQKVESIAYQIRASITSSLIIVVFVIFINMNL